MDLNEALADWRANRAYIDGNGNYHLKRSAIARSRIAPWNKIVKRAFPNVDDFHRAATGQTIRRVYSLSPLAERLASRFEATLRAEAM